MSLTWPWALLLLVVVPVLVVAYRRSIARQTLRREQLAGQGLVLTGAVARRDRWRHLAPALLLVALTLMLLALTRPVAAVAEPRREGTIVLAFDVSSSMAATDVRPTRLEAAKAAVRSFVEKQPAEVRLGVVAFGGTGVVTQRPTTDRTAVLAAIARLRAEGETSLGGGILESLSAIAGKPVRAPGDAEAGSATESPIGYYGGATIVLLSDGENTTGPEPAEIGDLASAAGVRIDPIGLGSSAGTVLKVDGFSIATALDEPALQQLAKITGGTYRTASDAQSLATVYESIELRWTTRTVPREITSYVSAAAALLLLAGASVSVVRQGRVV